MADGDPRNDAALRQLDALVVHPHEDMEVEIKGWLGLDAAEAKAVLAKAILALANQGGGFVVIGFTEDAGRWVPDSPRPDSLSAYSQDTINGIVQHYAEPSFHCDVVDVEPTEGEGAYPVVIVPGNHKVPIRARRGGPNGVHVRCNAYYIRRPGPSSDVPRSGAEWDALISRCVRASREAILADIRRIVHGPGAGNAALGVTQTGAVSIDEVETVNQNNRLSQWTETSEERWRSLAEDELADEDPSRYGYGTWVCSYVLDGAIKKLGLRGFLKVLSGIRGYSGWPPWWVPTRDEIKPYPRDGLVECWLRDSKGKDAAHSDFWLGDPTGLMFLLRGYQEDGKPNRWEPGRRLDLALPVWRLGECLLHASGLSAALGDSKALVSLYVQWRGLRNRELVSWTETGRHIDEGRVSQQDVVSSTLQATADEIPVVLPELTRDLTAPLYEAFDFFRPHESLFEEELSRMIAGRR